MSTPRYTRSLSGSGMRHPDTILADLESNCIHSCLLFTAQLPDIVHLVFNEESD
ncbi:MAG: hypothetical protein WCK53_11385 [Methanomicrobiales archaeon]